MLDVQITFRNYRCIGDEPATIRISDGFTALVGTNNSGKSAILRAFYELRHVFTYLATAPNDTGAQSTIFGTTNDANTWGNRTVALGERIWRSDADRPIQIDFIIRDGPEGPFANHDMPIGFSITYYSNGQITTVLKRESGSPLPIDSGKLDGAQVDIRPLSSVMAVLSRAMYVGPFRNAVNIGAHEEYYDIQIGEGFIHRFADYKSGPNPLHNEAVHQMTQEIKRIFGFQDLEINPAEDYKVLQLMVDGRSYRLAEQGAGLAHFIVVLANVLIQRPSLLLIDEPELNLHAALQLDFLETLARHTDHGVVFATHSLGLARTAADRIYSVAKPVGGTSTVRPFDGERELVTLLGQLSFEGRPDLGFSRVLLVEGKTELRALMQFLRLYRKEHQVLMIPLHGADMIRGDVEHELAEVLRIGRNVHYLIDSERTAADDPLSTDRQGFVDLCAKLAIGGHVLERRALENYFTDAAVKRAFGPSAGALSAYEKKGASQNWPKANNFRAASQMSRDDLGGTDLGSFLEGL